MMSYHTDVAINIEEHVLQITPTRIGRIKLLIVSPQNIRSGTITITVVSEVMIERPRVCLILRSTSGARPFALLLAEFSVFSLIRSKITIVSFIP